MAKGLINESTLTAIADAIRVKTETSDAILPADMAAMIEAIETGVTVGKHYGEVTIGSSANQNYIQTGVTLPDYKYYGLFIMPVNGGAYGAYTFYTPSKKRGGAFYNNTFNNSEYITIGHKSTGTSFTHTYGVFASGKTYLWVYFEWVV